MKEEFQDLDVKIDNEMVPYLVQNYSMKDLDKYGPLGWTSNTQLPIDKNAIFRDLVFENNLDDLLYGGKVYGVTLRELYKIQAQIIELTENK